MSELDKLETYLKEHKIVHCRIDKPADNYIMEGFGEQHQIIVYDKRGERQWDAICQWGSYGYEQGLLEICGTLVDEEKDGDSVAGYLTAEEVIAILEAQNR